MDPPAARSLFPLTQRCVFMNHAGVAPLSDRGRAAIEALMAQLTDRPYQDGLAEQEAERLRASIGRLAGAEPDTIGIVGGAAHGMVLLAEGLDWREGDNVVGARGDDLRPWAALRSRGVELRLAEPVEDRLEPAAVLSLVDDRTRVVALSHVHPWSGLRLDVERIGADLDRRGVVFALDGAQSVGALRLDLAELPVDYLVADACRWMLGPLGSGFRYCRPELQRRLQPALAAEPFASILDIAAFQAAVDLLLELGADTIEERVLGLAGRLSAGLAERGHELVGPWPREPRERSGIVGFRRPGSPASEVLRDLNAARVVAQGHEGLVRLSPHFYNTPEEVEQVLDVLAPETQQQ